MGKLESEPRAIWCQGLWKVYYYLLLLHMETGGRGEVEEDWWEFHPKNSKESANSKKGKGFYFEI